MMIVAPDGQSITCHVCGATSYNQNDVKHRYCGRCHRFYDVDLPKLSLAELAIGESVLMDTAAEIVLKHDDALERIKANCRASVYWPEFCRMAAAGQVAEDFAGPGVISRCVIGWAKQAKEVA